MSAYFFQPIDENVLFFLQSIHNKILDTFFWSVSEAWIFIPLWLWAIIKIYQQYSLKNFLKIILMILIIITLSDQISNVSKYHFKRLRTTHNEIYKGKIKLVNNYEGGLYGFYSAHASNSAAITVLALLIIKRSKWKYIIFIYPLLTGISRMYLAVHYLSDILVGWIVGAFLTLFVYLLFKQFLHINKQ